MKTLIAVLAVLFVPGASALTVGEQAPALEGVTWVKGSGPRLPGELTLVEFWATWCGPCRRSIPHLTDLAKTYAGKLAVVGLSDEDEDTVRPFVEKQGDSMDYAVGIVPAAVRAGYMAGVPGIPHAFLVDASGVVVWKGHPMRVDEILAKAVSGSVDVQQLGRLASLTEALDRALRTRNMESVAEKADALLAVDPFHEKARYVRLFAAKQQNDRAAFAQLFTSVPVADLSADQAVDFARTLLSEPDLTFRLPELALELSAAAVEKAPNRADALAIRARAHYAVGAVEQAVHWQKLAVAASGESSGEYELVLDYYFTIQRLKAQSE